MTEQEPGFAECALTYISAWITLRSGQGRQALRRAAGPERVRPAGPTAHGVRKPQNRRMEIVLGQARHAGAVKGAVPTLRIELRTC